MLPEATIKHRLPRRVRLQIDSHRGDVGFFQNVEARLKESFAYRRIDASVVTGSLVLEDDHLDVEQLGMVGRELALFDVSDRFIVSPPLPVVKRMVAPLRWTNTQIDRLSAGALDLAGALIICLIGLGLLELARGGFRRPPWYTLFWYAFGLFSKTLFDELSNDADAGG